MVQRRRWWWLGVVVIAGVVLGACRPTWSQLGADGGRSGANPSETAITPATVASLGQQYETPLGRPVQPPVVDGPRVFVVDQPEPDHFRLVAVDGTPAGCSGSPRTCPIAWTAGLDGPPAAPLLVGGRVLVATAAGSGGSGGLLAFDAAGVDGCSTGVCRPVWRSARSWYASTPAWPPTPPSVVGDSVIVHEVGPSHGGSLARYPLAPTGCTPDVDGVLWCDPADSNDELQVLGNTASRGPDLLVADQRGSVVVLPADRWPCLLACPQTYARNEGADAGAWAVAGPALAGRLLLSPTGAGTVVAADLAACALEGGDEWCPRAFETESTGRVRSGIGPSVASDGHTIVAVDPAGIVAYDLADCLDGPPCARWTSDLGSDTAATIAGGLVWVAAGCEGCAAERLAAFDADDLTGCTPDDAGPPACDPVWTGLEGADLVGAPVVVGGKVVVLVDDRASGRLVVLAPGA